MNVPLVCAGARIRPGDIIVADDDGVCVVAREDAADILTKSKVREEKEAEVRKENKNPTLRMWGKKQVPKRV